jgi:3',5'-cyclic-AMP phosphodiesterase
MTDTPTAPTDETTGATTEVTTVADDLAVLHRGTSVRRHHDLAPDTEYDFDGITVRTLARPDGEFLCRFATVNDVHFGEVEAGRIDDHPDGPIRRADPGAPPYPEVMNAAAAAEIAAIDPTAVVVKGDLTQDGRREEWDAFERCYRAPFGDRLHVVRGNHDSYRHQAEYAGDQWIELPGVVVALLDTAIPGASTGTISTQQLEWLDDHCATVDRPVFVMGHHQQWIGAGPDAKRSDDYFGLHPDPSDALDEVAARRPAILAYAAGHTHRHRVRLMSRSRVPSIEIGCTKDFPGTWAEYRVYDGGIMQVVHRMSSPEALAWSESCRHLYRDFGVDYASYALGTLADRCFTLTPR